MTEPLARGIRNNNPGNLRLSPDSRGRFIGQKRMDEHGYMVFHKPMQGLYSLTWTLVDLAGEHINTVAGLIAEFSPGGESSEAQYSKYLAEDLDVGEFEKIDIVERLEPILRSIITYECGKVAYTPEQISMAASVVRNHRGEEEK